MKPKKRYPFLKTSSVIADVISRVRSMQTLTAKEELIYFIHVKGMTEEAAEKFIKSKLNTRKII